MQTSTACRVYISNVISTTLDNRYDQIIRLKKLWKYYLEEAKQEPEVQEQLAEIRKSYKGMGPKTIKFIDPCMGSGHILVYAFEVLMQIYTANGWDARDAAKAYWKTIYTVWTSTTERSSLRISRL